MPFYVFLCSCIKWFLISLIWWISLFAITTLLCTLLASPEAKHGPPTAEIFISLKPLTFLTSSDKTSHKIWGFLWFDKKPTCVNVKLASKTKLFFISLSKPLVITEIGLVV